MSELIAKKKINLPDLPGLPGLPNLLPGLPGLSYLPNLQDLLGPVNALTIFFFAITSLIAFGSMLANMANSAKTGISLSACLMGFWLPSFFWLP